MRTLRRLLCVFTVILLCAPGASAQEYPNRPVRILLGFPVGQATDILARLVAARLSTQHGQQFFVENRPGAAGIIATEMAAKAEPDGYTLLATSSGPLAVNPTLYPKIPYDVPRDFVVFAGLGIVPYAVVVKPALPVRTIQELVAHAKANPGKLNYASSGNGSTNQFAAELLKSQAGIEMTHVPYKGMQPAIGDVAGGHIPLMFSPIPLALPLIQAGKLRMLGVTTTQRIEPIPQVPPLAEIGVPGFNASTWFMLAAPAKTPQAIIDKLYAELRDFNADPAVRAELVRQGLMPVVSPSPDELKEFVRSETARFDKIVRQSGLAGTQ
jgi:tripartite-type tricarboxylate transporter receptor subunit TctC